MTMWDFTEGDGGEKEKKCGRQWGEMGIVLSI